MLTFHRSPAIIGRWMSELSPSLSPRAAATARGLFRNLGTTLQLMRGLRRKSQGWVARQAGIGKGQLSKYETGKELPKLESLSKVLAVLEVGHLEFFYTLHFIDQQAASGGGFRSSQQVPAAAAVTEAPPPGRPQLDAPRGGPRLHAETTQEAFTTLLSDLLLLYRKVFEDFVGVGAARLGGEPLISDSPPERVRWRARKEAR